MPNRMEITLTQTERRELEKVRDHHELPYMRERAAAILKVVDGHSGRQVALQGLFKPRQPDTVYDWIHRWQQEGIHGLVIRKGRGRKPAFSPSTRNV